MPIDASTAELRPETWLASLRPRVRSTLNLALALALASGVVLMLQAWLVARVVAAGVVHRAATPWPWLLALLPLFALRFALTRAAERVAFRAGARLRGELRDALLRQVQRLGPGWLRGQSRGEIVSSAVDGIEALEAYYARYLPAIGATALVPAAILLVVLPVDWISGLVLLLTAPLIPLFMWLIGKGAEELNQRQWARLTYLSGRFLDTLQGLTTLKLLGAARREADVVAQVSEDYRVSTMRVLRVAFLSSVVLEFLATVSIAVVAVLIGFRLLWGEMHLRAGLFVLLLAPELYLPLRALGGLRHTRMDALAAAQHLSGLDDIPPASGAPLVSGARAAPEAPPEIRIDRVSYAHGGRAAALRDCSIVLKAHRVTALVGATGAGKSTLLNLLLGFAVPDGGRIWIDGVDLTALDPAQWRARVAWVAQQTHVFEGSVRDNLLLAAADADADAVRRAAERSGLAAVIERLPKGWDTQLGERGLGLSGGELQRLALARALLRERARVWLLDEPTAHLDPDGTRAVEAVIRAAAATHTVVLVAHRLSAARSADWVAVLRDGRVLEQGTPLELERSRGAYADLLQAELS